MWWWAHASGAAPGRAAGGCGRGATPRLTPRRRSAQDDDPGADGRPGVERLGLVVGLADAARRPVGAELGLALERSPVGIAGDRVEPDRQAVAVGEAHHPLHGDRKSVV